MAKRKAKLTPRQKQSQQIMRDKAAKKRRKALVRKFGLVGGGVFLVAVLGGGFWAWKSGAAARTAQSVVDGAYGLTAKAGFSLQSLYLEGRNRTSMQAIEKALGVKKGDPILQHSLSELRHRLEAVESIKFAAVERALPGTLYIRIVEREPVAMWQNGGKLALVDDNGVVMTGIDIAPYHALPLIIGDNAPKHVAELLTMLTSQPELTKRFSAAIWVGDRRWNIRLNGDIEVKLPEDNAQNAWKHLAELQDEQRLLDRDVKEIDLRLEDKMFIKLTPEGMPDKGAANARET